MKIISPWWGSFKGCLELSPFLNEETVFFFLMLFMLLLWCLIIGGLFNLYHGNSNNNIVVEICTTKTDIAVCRRACSQLEKILTILNFGITDRITHDGYCLRAKVTVGGYDGMVLNKKSTKYLYFLIFCGKNNNMENEWWIS